MRGLPKALVLLGPPGAGKGTQADILAEREGFFHFETSKVIDENFKAHSDDDHIVVGDRSYRYRDERERFESGILMTPEVIAFWVAQKIRELSAQGKKIVFSGSPRTLSEVERLTPILEGLYGKDAIRVVVITIPEEESIHRNSHRRICEQCRAPVPFLPETKDDLVCKRCGGKLIRRGSLDTPEVLRVRLREYAERTAPVIAFFKERGIALRTVSGEGGIAAVARRVQEALENGAAVVA